MAKPLRLDRDGKLAIRESAVERTIREFLEVQGWIWINTKAESRMPNGALAHGRYTLDAVALRPPRPWPGLIIPIGAMFLEFKCRNARTDKARLTGQTANAQSLRKLGFAVYQAAEKDSDPIGSFKRFYEEIFR